LRTYLLGLVCCLVLSSCAYYGDIHGSSQQLEAKSLSTHHTYQAAASAAAAGWWRKFKDPQLNQLINTALVDSPTLQIAETRVRRAEHLAEETGAALWPSVDFSGYVQRQRFSTFGLAPPPFNGRTYNIGTLGLNFNYEFDFWGKNRQALKARISERYAAEADLAEAQLVISAAVAHTYFQLLGDIAEVNIANENWQVNKQLLKIATTRAKHGIYSDIPVTALAAYVQGAKVSLEHYREREQLSRHRLAVLMGKNPLTTDIITRKWVYHSYQVAIPDSLPANLLANRPDISAARSRAQAAASSINVAKARFFPDINLGALFSYQSVGLGHLFDPQSQNNAITGAVDLPLFDAGARRANLGVKYAEYDNAINTYNKTMLTALNEVADQLSILQTVKAQIAAESIALKAAERTYKLFNSRYNRGIADYSFVLLGKQILLQHRSTQLNLQTRHLQAVVATLKALGGNDFIGQG